MKLEEALGTTRFESRKHQALLNVLYTAYWYGSHTGKALKELGLTLEQFNVLRILKGKNPEPMCVKDIGSRMIEKCSNVPRIADRLVAKKLVKRTTSAQDRRETLIGLTPKGIEQLENANKVMGKISSQIVDINEEEATTLHAILEKLRKAD